MIVLLADPDPATRRPVRIFLENRGVRVSEAGDLEEARDVCARTHPSAMVTETFGEDVGRTLRELRALAPGVPILVWTAPGDDGLRDRVRADGHGFLEKPALPAEVAFALGRVSPPARRAFPGPIRPPVQELRRRNRQRPALG